MNCKELSHKLKALIKMKNAPVAIKVYDNEEDAKKDLPKYDGKARHCKIVYDVSVKKQSFYTTIDGQECPNGMASLGLIDKEVTFPQIPPLKQAIGYSQLEDCTFKPDVIIIYVTVTQALTVAQFYRTSLKKRFVADFNGTASLCADCVARPYNNGESNMSLGCAGSRAYSDIKDEEMVVSLTLSDAKEIVKFI